MFIGVLNIVHNATTLLFGVFASAAFLGIRLNRKNNLTLLLFSCVSGAIHLFVYHLYGTSFSEQLYPLITHIPLVLLLTLYYKYNAAISILSVLIPIQLLPDQQLDWYRSFCADKSTMDLL